MKAGINLTCDSWRVLQTTEGATSFAKCRNAFDSHGNVFLQTHQENRNDSNLTISDLTNEKTTPMQGMIGIIQTAQYNASAILTTD